MHSRGVHYNPTPGTAAFRQGKSQAEISNERYHILCAALRKQFTTRDAPRNAHGGYLPYHGFDAETGRQNFDVTTLDPWTRQTLDFSACKHFPLTPVSGIKLHPREDGSIHPGDLEVYRDGFESNWKTQEGSLLYCIAEYRDFFNCMLNYQSPARTSGMLEWEKLFRKLEATGYPKGIIPCMGCDLAFFNVSHFINDRTVFRKAVLESRAHVITKRHETLTKPTPKQIMDRQRMILDLEAGDDRQRRDALIFAGLARLTDGDRAYCANPECLKPWKQADATCPLQRCQKCKITSYCTRECQKKDWQRHKKEPCAPVEELVENDDIWGHSEHAKVPK